MITGAPFSKHCPYGTIYWTTHVYSGTNESSFGIPGAGKSVLTSAAIYTASRTVTSDTLTAFFFFCDYKKPETQSPKAILGSLVVQIAEKNERCYSRLQEFVLKGRQRPGNWASAQDPTDQLRALDYDTEDLELVFAKMANDLRQVMVFVDGLDECGDNVRRVAQSLRNVSQCSTQVKVYLSSRDIPDIRKALNGWPSISIAARSTDLLVYVGAQIKSRIENGIPKPLELDSENTKVEIMDALVDGAQGMFRWVSCRYLPVGP